MNKIIYVSLVIIMTFFLVLVIEVDAKASSFNVEGTKFVFEKDFDYQRGKHTHPEVIKDGSNTWGELRIDGNIEKIGQYSYNIKDGVFSLSYDVNNNKYSYTERMWHIDVDNDNDIDNIDIENDIGRGAVVVRTSFDGIKWSIDKMITDIFYSGSSETTWKPKGNA